MIAFRGRLLFLQYNPSKSHKYGIKVYKLCTPDGFTWASSIYCGGGTTLGNLDKPGTVVVSLGDNLLDEGCMIITDNFYTSVPLAEYLYERKTDLCGTIRKNRKWLPKEVVNQKLNKGQFIAGQKEFVAILKWHDKRDVIMLSTCHGDRFQNSGKVDRQGNPKIKPQMILDYNKTKQGIDVSDQYSSYYNPQRKSLIWYKKVAMELLFGITVVNSIVIFNKQVTNKLSLLQFTESLSRHFLCTKKSEQVVEVQKNIEKHFLKQFDRVGGRFQRKRCHGCYLNLRQNGKLSSRRSWKKKQKKLTHIANYVIMLVV